MFDFFRSLPKDFFSKDSVRLALNEVSVPYGGSLPDVFTVPDVLPPRKLRKLIESYELSHRKVACFVPLAGENAGLVEVHLKPI